MLKKFVKMLRLIKNSAYVIYEWSHSMDEKLLKVTAQRMNEGNGQGLVSLDGALATLHDAEDRVRRIVSQRFDEAVQSDDLASIERLEFVYFTKYVFRYQVSICKWSSNNYVDRILPFFANLNSFLIL